MKILLLNPPGEKIYTRDYYCSKISKSDYIYHPTDLLILSGILAEKHEVFVLDAIAEKMSPEECEKKIFGRKYDVIVFLTGSVSWNEDSSFMRRLKGKTDFLAIGTGDVLLDEYRELMEKNNFLDAVILDFTTDDILRYLEKDFSNVNNMAFRTASGIADKGVKREFNKEFEIPVPKHELFPNKKYSYPFVRRSPFATVLTDYGCPFLCDFCVINSLGFKYRKLKNVFEEILYLKKSGFKNIYFNDQTFGAKRERLEAICRFFIENKINMGWVCWSRVDVVSEDTLKLMKKAGCHTILFGVETSNDEILKENKKGFLSERVKNVFNLCRKLGIRTLGTFLFGLPGESKESCEKTIEFAKEIGADFASFNVLIPRMNTNIRKQAIAKGWVEGGVKIMDQSGNFSAMGSDKMTAGEILDLKKRADRNFYLRPSYFIRRMASVRTPHELKLLALNGFSVIKNIFKRRDE